MATSVETAPLHPKIDALRRCGADQLAPVRFRYLEALALRLQTRGLQHTRHWQKLEQAIADYTAAHESSAELSQVLETSPPSPLSTLLDKLNQAPDVLATAPQSTLERLVFGAQKDGTEASQHAAPANTQQPLKAMARVNAGRGEQALQERIRHAIEEVPQDAGPINAHRLVSRAMAEIQKLSPAYINRFVNYTDTLMALERLARKG